MMIYAADKGRMCNNILQFGHVRAFARRHGRECVSARLCYKYPYFRISRDRRHNPLRYLLSKAAAFLHLMPVVDYDDPGEGEESRRCKESIILAHKNVMVRGWEVRHYDDFLRYKNELLELFAFLPEVEEKVAPLLEAASGRFSIGIHVRRGDYARWQGGKYFYSDRQYAGVARKIAALYPDRKIAFYVCGNDREIDRRVYMDAVPDAEFIFAEGNSGEDLCLLSHCDLLAGAPSTFSLWASAYRDIPLYWIKNPTAELNQASFASFNRLFREII